MAARYFKTGATTWNTANNWSATGAGGADNAGVPTAADDVIFELLSGNCTINVTPAVCRSLDTTSGVGSYAGTLTHNAATVLTIGDGTAGAGNVALKLNSGMTYTLGNSTTSSISFVSTSTTQQSITWGGKTPGSVTFNGSLGTWQLQDTWTAALTTVTLQTGALALNNQTCSWNVFNSSFNGNVRSLTAGTASITLASANNSNTWGTGNDNGLTLSVASSTITFTGNGAGLTQDSDTPITWGTVIFSGAGRDILTAPGSTFGTLTRQGVNPGDGLQLGGNITVTGTLTLTGASAANRLLVQSTVVGTTRTITCNGTLTTSNSDWMDIAGAGSVSWNLSAISGGAGDALGNSGITFTTPVNRYGVNAGSWNSTSRWSATSGGASGASIPLCHDDVFLDANSTTGTYTVNQPRAGRNIDCTGFTGTLAWTDTSGAAAPVANIPNIFGNFKLVPGMTFSITSGNSINFNGRGSHTITSAGQSFAFSSNRGLGIGAFGGSYTLQDDLLITGGATDVGLKIDNGTFDANGFNVTSIRVQSSGAVTRSIIMGTGTWTLTSVTSAVRIWDIHSTATVSGASATIVISTATPNTRSFEGGGHTYGALRYTVANSPGQLSITGANTFGTLEIDPGRILAFTAATTNTVTTWNVDGEDFGYQYLPGLSGNYASIPDSVATSITGDIDIRAAVAMNDWTPSAAQTFLAKRGAAGQVSYHFLLQAAGTIRMEFSTDGTAVLNATSTVAPTVSDGALLLVRATIDVDDGAGNRVTKFYTKTSTAVDAPVDTLADTGWTQLGTTVTTAGAISIFNSTAGIEIGSRTSGTGDLGVGKYYAAVVKSGIDGTTVFNANFVARGVGSNTFTESSSEAATVTISGEAAQAGDGRVELKSVTAATHTLHKGITDSSGNHWSLQGSGLVFNTDNVQFPGTNSNYVSIPDITPFTGDLDVRVEASADSYGASGQYFAAQWGSAGQLSWRFGISASRLYTGFTLDGATESAASSDLHGVADGVTKYWRFTRVASTGLVTFYTLESGVWTQVGTTKTVTSGTLFDASARIAIGALSTSNSVLAGKIYKAEIRNGIDGTIVANPVFTKTNISSDYLRIQNSIASGLGTWYAGANSIDVSGNTGWIFTDAPSGAASKMALMGVG